MSNCIIISFKVQFDMQEEYFILKLISTVVSELKSECVCVIDIKFLTFFLVCIYSASVYLYGCLFLTDLKVP